MPDHARDFTEYDKWEPTPLWRRVLGWPRRRRKFRNIFVKLGWVYTDWEYEGDSK